jgi:hypothetical protein
VVTKARLAGLALAVAALLSGAVTDAGAAGHGLPSTGTDHGGSSGGSKSGSDGNGCSFYANASRFGVACGTATTTVRDILTTHHEPLVHPDCWDIVISSTDLPYYGYAPPNDGYLYYRHSCATGDWADDNSPHNQPNVEVSQIVIQIPVDAPNCPHPWNDSYLRTCKATLTEDQTTLVTAMADGGTIPSITLSTHPSTTVRTNVLTGFGDTAFDPDHHTVGGETQHYQLGGVEMWAVMTRYLIYPYGPGANAQGAGCYNGAPFGHFPTAATPGTCEDCDGPTMLNAGSTPDSAPRACWWSYPKSSHGEQANETYNFRAEADWTVMYRDAPGAQAVAFADFRKWDDIDLPVYDVQSITVS